MNETEKRFEEFIETYLVSENGGWTKATDAGYCSDESKDKYQAVMRALADRLYKELHDDK